MNKALLIILLMLVAGGLQAQDKSNKGKEFWLGYGNNILFDHDFPANHQTLVLYLSAETATDVTVTVNGTSWSRTVHIPANTVDFSIELPKEGAADCRIIAEGVFDRAIHVVSAEPIVAYAHQYDTQLSGATMLMPVETYGYTYYSINYSQPYTPGSPGKCWFFIVANEDNTTLEITPADTTEGGRMPRVPFTVSLNKGQLYNVFGKISDYDLISKDLTGSKVVSTTGADGKCHPVAVFSGNSRFIVCNGDGGEVAQQQIFPASAWGTRYLAYHSFNTVSNPLTSSFLNFYRVAVSDPATVVKRNGVVLTGLTNNFYYEFQSTSGDYIEADKPIMVCQYTPSQNQCTGTSQSPQGDPEMFFLSPIEQGIKKATVYNTRNSNITVSYLTVILPRSGIGSLRIDGAAVAAAAYTEHPANPGYLVVAKRLLGPAAQHTIESDSAFTAMIYGTGFWESYGYIAGTLVNNLNSVGSIKNLYNSSSGTNSFTCPRSPVQFNVKLAYKATSLEWLLSRVSGISPAKDTVISDPIPVDSQLVNGRRYFSYTLTGAYTFADTGTFYIPFVYTCPSIDNCSKTDTSTITVIVKPGPVADFTARYQGCAADTAFFTAIPDTGNYLIDRYRWTYDDGSTDSARQVGKLFAPAVHLVQLKTISVEGCVGDTAKPITTWMPPVAAFGHDRDVCIGDSIHFTDSSSIDAGTIASWQWNFDDGDSSTRRSGTPFYHFFADTGQFRVSLTVISALGCSSAPVSMPVAVNEKPVATFSYAGAPCTDSSLRFIPVVKTNANIIQSIYWDFGDGQQAAGTQVAEWSHTYTNSQRNIPVRYVVSGGAGCVSDTAALMIAAINASPVAKFGYDAPGFCAGNAINFTDSSTAEIQVWRWDFGDGNTVSPPPVKHTFAVGGNYNVQLTVSDNNGCGSAAFISAVTINPNPVVDAGPAILKNASAGVRINATVAGGAGYQYAWTPAQFLSAADVLTPVTTTSTDMVYTLRVSGGPGNCTATDTVSVIVIKELFIPNAFSPNGDGLNDAWNIPAIRGNASAMTTIYNRWGQKIYAAPGNQPPWDGKVKGVPQPGGAYYYIIQPDIRDPKKFTGSVTLIR